MSVLEGEEFPLRYKYILVTRAGQELWETTERTLSFPFGKGEQQVLIQNDEPRFEHSWSGAGVAVPLFSLRSKDSFGIGEFADLKPFVNWARQAGLSLVQLLPVTDTTVNLDWRDSYPYSPMSVFALHPIYLRLSQLTKDAGLLAAIKKEGQPLNKLPEVDYTAVWTAKLAFLKKIFAARPKSDPEVLPP
jgi:4-alpha-glucanotransferase